MNKLKIDETLCVGCGACTVIAPDIFVLDQDSGKAKVVSQPKEIDNQIKMAIESCPVKAIKIERKEDESKK